MYLTIPLALTADILDFDNTPVASFGHQAYTTDISNGSLIWPYRQYKSSHHLPPHLRINRYNKDIPLAEGYIFVTPSDVRGQDGTMELQGTGYILTHDGDLVYAAEETGMGFCTQFVSGMTDFRQQDYRGEPYLVYWNGCNTRGTHWGHRWGRVTFIDDKYENFTINPDLNIQTGDPANIGQIDVHEHELTNYGSILVSSYNNTQRDLTSVGGAKDGWLAESMFFDVDVETQNVHFSWAAANYIGLDKSRMPGAAHTAKNRGWDWFHINSVQKVGENYLVSARHHWAVYLISGTNGSVIWTLDGVHGGDFGPIEPEAQFKWQHHARAHEVSDRSMIISVFDNFVNGDRRPATQTRGIALKISLPPNKDEPVTVYRNLRSDKHPLYSSTQGSYQMDVGNGNGFIGYGSTPVAREFSVDGKLLWSGRYGYDGAVQSYRATKQKWSGTPKNWSPNLVIEESDARPPRAYVSWNGATDIDAWAVYAGDRQDELRSVGVAKKQGFETAFDLGSWKCVRVGAIRDGRILRASNTACLGR